MHDLPGMTVQEHHLLTIGNLAMCYEHVPLPLQYAIREALESAQQMGLNISLDCLSRTSHLSE